MFLFLKGLKEKSFCENITVVISGLSDYESLLFSTKRQDDKYFRICWPSYFSHN